MLKNKKIKFLIVAIAFVLLSCSGDGGSDEPPVEQEIIPTNLTINVKIVGVDTSNPNGNGSGEIVITATATNAVSYKIKFGDGTQTEVVSGIANHTYTTTGTNNYTIEVFAFSETGNSIGDFVRKNVLVLEGGFSLVWSDEFDVDGAPDSSKWTYDIGTGDNGWGNGESQYYTDRSENVIVSDGTLKIIAKKESFNGSQYTSARLLTHGLFDFTYGKVEIRAKLPSGGGTWPALWMLGSNFQTNTWPACGEIDIMEHVGNNQGKVQSAIHTPSSFGNTVNLGSTNLDDVSATFHIYSLSWTSEKLDFAVDGNVYYTYNPSVKDNNTWPFDTNQFLIMNVAMGGGLGGAIDSNFDEAAMEIDYVKVYQ